VVVDHGSMDGTSEWIRREFPEVVVAKGDSALLKLMKDRVYATESHQPCWKNLYK